MQRETVPALQRVGLIRESNIYKHQYIEDACTVKMGKFYIRVLLLDTNTSNAWDT